MYLRDLEDGGKAQRVIGEWMEFYNVQRPHSALAGRTPEKAYRDGAAKREEDSRRRREARVSSGTGALVTDDTRTDC